LSGPVVFLLAVCAVSETRYVWPDSPSPAPPYTNWATAAHTIQDAVEISVAGDTVVVTDGTYESGTAVTPDNHLMCRVVVTNNILLRSVNGPQYTVIRGAADPTQTDGNGPAAVRGVYLARGTLQGFRITGGHTQRSGDRPDTCGGGIYGSGTVTGCWIVGNAAASDGGGAYGGRYYHCRFENNCAGWLGGGACNVSASDCHFSSNWALSGGGAYFCRLRDCELFANFADSYGGGGYECGMLNCTVASNHAAGGEGGGIYGGGATNSIIYYNYPGFYEYRLASLEYSCSRPLPSGPGNISNAPHFVDLPAGDLHLQADSPCIDRGADALMADAADPDGVPRPLDGDADATSRVDMGCYEFISPSADTDGDGIPDRWEWDRGLDPTDAADGEADSDGDSFSNRKEYLADTDPWDADSCLHLISLEVTNGMSVLFACTNTRDYSLQRRPTLLSGGWEQVPGQEGVPGDA